MPGDEPRHIRSGVSDLERARDDGLDFWHAFREASTDVLAAGLSDVEPSQEQEAYLFQLDSPIGRLLAAATNPSDTGLRQLREVAEPAQQAVEADENLITVKAALEDATSARGTTWARMRGSEQIPLGDDGVRNLPSRIF